MSRIFLIILVALCVQVCVAQEKEVLLNKPLVDKKVELIGIVFRMAEAPGYSFPNFKLYVDRIEQYFGKYKDHELIQYTKSLVNENGIDWDAPLKIAIRLDANMKLMNDVTDIWKDDGRWSKESAEKFALLLQRFVKDTKFDNFFGENTDLYTAAIDRFTQISEQVDLNWYRTFLGKELSEKFMITIGVGNGGNCNGVSLDYVDGSRTVYPILGVWEIDNEGLPVYDKQFPYFETSTLAILLHELNHPYVNPLTEKYQDLFKESAEKIHSALQSRPNSMAGRYPWKTMLDEALVRACVIKYMKDHDFPKSEIDNEIKLQKEWWGFFWIEELVTELERYDKQRDIYPTLESYMPKLAQFYTVLSKKV